MSVRKILYEPNDKLHQVADVVEFGASDLKQVLTDLEDTLGTVNGIGLAATQIGIMQRVIIIDLRDVEKYDDQHVTDITERRLFKIINPRITNISDTTIPMNEGCLSLPTVHTDIIRPSAVEFEYFDENFEKHQIKASGLLAKCIQHEIDHLNGKTMLNYMSLMKKNMALQKIRKVVRSAGNS